MSEAEEDWTRSAEWNLFAAVVFFLMAIVSAVFYLVERQWIPGGSALVFAGLMSRIYWTTRRSEQRKEAERLAAGDLFGTRTEGERVAAGDAADPRQ